MQTNSANMAALPTRLNSFALYLMSLALMIGLYSLYARFLVPIVEGPPNIVRHEFSPPNVELPIQQFDKKRLATVFPADAWENTDCKVLVTDQGLVMFKDYHRMEGGYLEVLPFTLVMRSANKANSNDPSSAQPTVLRCSKGARLKFDDPEVDPLAGKSKLESAWLVGGVDIYRPASDPLKDDSIEILTSNVQINKRQIFTIDEVRFAFGSHRGHGRQLSIELSHLDKPSRQQGFESISGIKRIELAYLKQLQLIQKQNSPTFLAVNHSLPKESTQSNGLLESASDPVNITCSGPFVMDLQRKSATFNDQVSVSMEGKNQSEITCKRLTVYFDSKGKHSSQIGAPPSSTQTDLATEQWTMQRLVAEGTPATFFSESHAAKVSGNILSYNVIQQEIVAQKHSNSLTPVNIVTPEFHFQAIQVAYKLRSDGGLGEIIAQGPGSLLRAATKKDREFYLEWERLLSVEPDGTQQVITLADGCHIRLDKTTQVKARQMKVWLNEIVSASVEGTENEKTDFQYQPDRLIASQNVEMVSLQLNGKTEKLTAVWTLSDTPLQEQAHRVGRRSPQFVAGSTKNGDRGQRSLVHTTTRYASNSPQVFEILNQDEESPRGMQRIDFVKMAQRQSASTEYVPITPSNPVAELSELPRANEPLEVIEDGWVHQANFQNDETTRLKRYTFQGSEVDVKLLYHGEVTIVQDLTATGDVALSEVADAFANSNRPPLTITGNHLRCVPLPDESVRVLVTGTETRLALVKTEQFELKGNQIHLDQAANKLWVDGYVEIALQPQLAANREDRSPAPPGDLQNAAGTTQRLDFQNSDYKQIKVSAMSGMVFNGRKVYFEDGVKLTAEGMNKDGNSVLTTANGQGVTLELNQQVNFRDLNSDSKQEVEIREVVIVNQVAGGQRVFNLAKANLNQGELTSPPMAAISHQTSTATGQLMERQKFLASQITMDVRSGLVTSKGPGNLTHHRRGGTTLMGGKTGGASNRNRVSPLSETAPSTNSGITLIRVNFDGSANASMSEKRLLIRGNVRTLYANVDSFERDFDPDVPHALPKDAVRVKCDRLDFTQWTPRNSEEPVQDLLAAGNAHVTSSSFEAVASQIRYYQATDTLVVEGTARSDAQLWYHPVANPNDRKHLVAQKVTYRPGDQSYEIEAIKNIDSKN